MSKLSLQTRFLLIMGLSSLLLLQLLYQAFGNFSERALERIGARFAEKQMLYDKVRTLQPLMREIALARQSADSPLLRQWSANERDPELFTRAMEKMDKLRNHFLGGSYFIALKKSGHFYYNDAEGQYDGRQLRYTLRHDDPEDAWFFDFINSGEAQRIRVAPNDKLGVSKIWIRVPIRDGDKVIGVLGTGLNLDDFIHNVSGIFQPGVTNMFINKKAAIQIYNDVDHVDFPGVFNFSEHQHSTDQIRTVQSNSEWVRQAIARLDAGSEVETEFVRINGKRYLAGMIALPEVGWYDLTLLDLSVLMPRGEFVEIFLVVILGALVLLSLLALLLHRLVLKPVAKLSTAAANIRKGDFSSPLPEEGGGEVSELAWQFNEMADAVYHTQHWLESEIEKRTRQLVDAQQILETSLQQERIGRETQATLMALMAHEMRSPVAVIGNTAQMLNVLTQSEHPELTPRIAKIMHSVKQLASLMDNFLTEKWLDMDRQGLNRVSGDLNQLCASIAESFIESHVRPITFEPTDKEAVLCADWQLVQIAIINLLDNASKYSSLDDAILLRVLHCNGDQLCVEVKDSGTGIPREQQSRVFEKFARGKHEDDIAGSGLGLYLVNWIARFHGGHTEFRSIEGQGSTFRLCLPKCDPSPATALIGDRPAPTIQSN
ncbi:MAG: ATP-binding protein [Gallionella sp.]|nr:ATP-binding protein [Gallionella sp.]